MGRAEEVDAELDALYDQVPDVGCKGLCADACTAIDGGPRELVRMTRAGVRLPPREEAIIATETKPGWRCPALVDGQCSVYRVRPMICRLWGASEDMPCEHGCRPVHGSLLTSAQTIALLDAAQCAGTPRQPVTVEQVEQRPADLQQFRAATARGLRNRKPAP